MPMDKYAAERAARAYLMGVADDLDSALKAYVAEVGPVDAAACVRSGDVPEEVAEETDERREGVPVDRYFAIAGDFGGRLVIPEDDEWPTQVSPALWQGERSAMPLGLWACGTGRIADLLERAVAVVGLGAGTEYGLRFAEDLGREVAESGVTVVSGLAYGIGGRAHRGAVAAGGATVSVLPYGLGVDFPVRDGSVTWAAADGGLALSEYPPDRSLTCGNPQGRNRLMACLGAGTVVVQARLRSGSRDIAKTATALGRVMMAVPGQVTSPMSAGCHELLRGGEAVMVTSGAEVLESCGFAPPQETSNETSNEPPF